jgi:hypothetical protein
MLWHIIGGLSLTKIINNKLILITFLLTQIYFFFLHLHTLNISFLFFLLLLPLNFKDLFIYMYLQTRDIYTLKLQKYNYKGLCIKQSNKI